MCRFGSITSSGRYGGAWYATLFPFPFTAYAKSLPVKLHLAISYGGLLATRRRINRGTILLSVGLVLFLLDFLV